MATPHAIPASQITDPMEDACSRFKEFLRQKCEKPTFTTIEKLELQVRQLESKQRKSSTTFKIGKSVNPIIKFLRRHSDAFDTMVQANPYPAALVWGSFKILLNVAWYHFHYFENLMKMLEEIGDGLPMYKDYEAILDLIPESRKVLEDVYYDIMVFLYQAYRVYKKRRSLMLCHNLYRTFQADFGDVSSKFDQHKETLKRYIQLTIAMRVKNIDFGVQNIQTDVQGIGVGVRSVGADVRDVGSGVRNIQAEMRKVGEGVEELKRHQLQQMRYHVDIQMTSQAQAEDKDITSWPLPANTAAFDQRRSIMKWISSSDPQQDLARVSQDRVESSGQWLLEQRNNYNTIYNSWLDSTDKRILRIVGRPGSGKSVLSTAIINHLQQQTYLKAVVDPQTAICTTYFFCSKSTQGQDFRSILAGLMKQILVQLTEVPACVVDCFQRSSGIDRNTLTIADGPEKLFKELSLCFYKLYVVIDGLDELAEPGDTIKSLLQHIKDLPNVRTVFLSRDIPTINSRLSSYPVIRLDGENTSQDIDRYLREQLEELTLEDEEMEISPEVRDMLSKKADGMFLWVKYIMSSLRNATSLEGIKKRISEMPKDLDEFYDSILVKLASNELRGLARRVIMLMCAASRPLKWDELVCMLGTDGSEKDGQIIKYKSPILKACSPLIETSTETNEFRFAHASVIEYFLNPKAKRSEAIRLEFAFQEEEAQTEIAFVCLNYLLRPDMKPQGKEQETGPFLEYAETFWGSHIIRSSYSKQLSDKMHDYLDSEARRSTWISRQLFRESSGFPLQHLIKIQKQLHELDAKLGSEVGNASGRHDWIRDVARILVEIDTSDFENTGKPRITYFEKLMVIRDLSREYTIRQRLPEAELWMTEALTTKQKDFGKEHICTVWLLNSLGIIYDQQHRVELSARTHEEALRIQEDQLGPMHLETVWTINELGRAQLPEDDLQIAWTLNTLARAYRKKGSTTKALECHQKATDIQRKSLGEEHPHLLWSIADMGRCHRDRGELAESIAHHRQCLEGRERVLGLDHADTLWAMNDLGLVLSEYG
ncbi:hypothetical protein ABW21_db0200332 [Orbilia brochopaga]|nr:hypothetical protein ABW21_db0200332 [Drechslerella brochopaga]